MFTKYCTQVSIVIILMTISITGFAQNKVVVVPLGGDTAYQVKSGQLLTGVYASSSAPGVINYIQISYPSPLPTGTPEPTLVVAPANGCDLEGTAPTGLLCFYPSSRSLNVDEIIASQASFGGSLHHYGFVAEIVDIFPELPTFALGSWAYRVP